MTDEVLADLKLRLRMTRWPQQIDGTEWQYGVDTGYLRRLVQYWQQDYDWRKHETRLNRLPQFTTKLDGLSIHFVHVKSPHADATPLVLVHGWPGSFVEFEKVIPMLTEPEKHGGNADDAFHVVVPSLPGFGFSQRPNERGWASHCGAEVIAKLMARLGYDRYLAQGGDWGSGIVRCWRITTANTAWVLTATSRPADARRPVQATESVRTNWIG